MAAEFARSVLGLVVAAALVGAPGALVCRLAAGRVDSFRAFLAGVLLWSSAGLLLAQLGRFSLAAAAALVVAAAILAGIALRGRRAKSGERGQGARPWQFGILACAAALTYLPPYETFIAASDSTMYLGAGVHLARHGSMKVADRIGAKLDPFQRHLNFPSVSLLGSGPFIRLAGGLLKSNRDDPEAVPAFFPLTPVWVALFTAGGDLRAGPLVAPLFQALTVWAVCLFAAEIGGALAGATAWLLLVSNFAFWWYGRFLLAEPLASFLLWAGLVEIVRAGVADRGALVLAGWALAAAGFARTEVVVLELAGSALIVAWGWPGREVAKRFWPAIAAWLPIASWVAFYVLMNPSHHQAYFSSDLAFARLRLGLLMGPGFVARLGGGLAVLALASGILAWRKGGRIALYWWRGALLCGLGLGLGLYVVLGGDFSPLRGGRWIARYLGWPVLLLSAAGAFEVARGKFKLPALGVAIWVVSALVFLLNPHVALKHPWAIRRFLPEVIPGLLVAAGLGGAGLLRLGARRAGGVAAVWALLVGAALFQGRPILGLWGKPLYRDTLASLGRVTERLEAGADVVVESMLADWELQIPLWLVYGHETIMAHAPGPYWRAISYTLTKPGGDRPLYWLTFGARGYVTTPRVFGLDFQSVGELPLVVGLPAQSADGPPAGAFLLRANLRLYRISRWNLPAKPRASAGQKLDSGPPRSSFGTLPIAPSPGR